MGLSLCAQGPRKAQSGLSAKISKEVNQDDKGQAEGRPLGVFRCACLSVGTLRKLLNMSWPQFPFLKMQKMKAI